MSAPGMPQQRHQDRPLQEKRIVKSKERLVKLIRRVGDLCASREFKAEIFFVSLLLKLYAHKLFRRLAVDYFGWCQRVGEEGVEEAVAGIVGSVEACFQPVTDRHKFIYLGDDADLLGEGWQRNQNLSQDFK